MTYARALPFTSTSDVTPLLLPTSIYSESRYLEHTAKIPSLRVRTCKRSTPFYIIRYVPKSRMRHFIAYSLHYAKSHAHSLPKPRLHFSCTASPTTQNYKKDKRTSRTRIKGPSTAAHAYISPCKIAQVIVPDR